MGSRAPCRSAAGLDALDQHLVRIAVAGGRGQHVDLDAVLPGDARLLLRLADVLVAVADEDDTLGSAFGKRSQRQFYRGGNVRVAYHPPDY